MTTPQKVFVAIIVVFVVYFVNKMFADKVEGILFIAFGALLVACFLHFQPRNPRRNYTMPDHMPTNTEEQDETTTP